MKKIYQKPAIMLVKVHTEKMIAASELRIGDTVTTASGAESRRRGSLWDDDEDADY